jgi:hypothetical protein
MPALFEKFQKTLPDFVTGHKDPFNKIGLQNNCNVGANRAMPGRTDTG